MSASAAAVLAVTACLVMVPAVRALRGRRRFGLTDRAGVVDGVATALFATALSRQVVPWGEVPAALWVVPVAATTTAALAGAATWRDLPPFAGSRWRRATGTGVSVALALAMVTAVLVG